MFFCLFACPHCGHSHTCACLQTRHICSYTRSLYDLGTCMCPCMFFAYIYVCTLTCASMGVGLCIVHSCPCMFGLSAGRRACMRTMARNLSVHTRENRCTLLPNPGTRDTTCMPTLSYSTYARSNIKTQTHVCMEKDHKVHVYRSIL